MSKDLGSPGSRQLLQLQLFPNFLKILDPPFDVILPRIVLIAELCFSLCDKFGLLDVEFRSAVFMIFGKLPFVFQCFDWGI